MRLTVIGTCQSEGVGSALEIMLPNVEINTLTVGQFDELNKCEKEDALNSNFVFHQPNLDIESKETSAKFIPIPTIVFRGFHPDMTYVRSGGGIVHFPIIGNYCSAICFAAYKLGYSEEETFSFYNKQVFSNLDYYSIYQSSFSELLAEGQSCGLDLSNFFKKWERLGIFMHTINHPKIEILCDIARLLVNQTDLSIMIQNAHEFIPDALVLKGAWSVYPEIAENYGLKGAYGFKGPASRVLNLKELIYISFLTYSKYQKDELSIPYFPTSQSKEFDLDLYKKTFAHQISSNKCCQRFPRATSKADTHPGLSDYQFWHTSVAEKSITDVDPVVKPDFVLKSSDRIASAGSCFAQHITNALKSSDYKYLVTEIAPKTISKGRAKILNYGTFSARYGNLYTARQLIQLFERAYDELHPVDNVWSRRDGKYVDPFRPGIEPTGFATEKQVELSRETHLSAVRKMFEELDVFIFTLGLTETWKSNIDGAVFPVAPKVVTDSIEISQYSFINFSSLDVKNDLLKFMQMLNKKNPTARMILTVSPVPLMLTYEDRSVVTSTCYSKSALRVAAEEVCQSEPNIAYFPSYEIICGHFSRGSYFGSDLRNVTQRGVDHVMRLFLAHYGNNKLTVPEISRDWETIFDVVCDEEQAQPLIGSTTSSVFS